MAEAPFTPSADERRSGAELRVLIVDDAADDAEMMARSLERAGSRVHFDRVETDEAMADALQRGGWDVVLCDYAMPSFSAERALAMLARTQPSLPSIIVSGAIGEEAAAAVIRAGAIDFVSKDHLTLLPAAVRRALDEAEGQAELARVAGELRDSEQRLHALLSGAGSDVLDRWTRLNLIRRARVLDPRSVRTDPTDGGGPGPGTITEAEPSLRANEPPGSMTAVEGGRGTDANPQELRREARAGAPRARAGARNAARDPGWRLRRARDRRWQRR